MWPWLTCTRIYSRLGNLTLTFIWRIGTLSISITCKESLKSRKTKIKPWEKASQLEKLYLFHLTSFYRTLVHICDQCYSMKILHNAYYNQKFFMMPTEVSLNNSWLHVAKCNLGKVNLEAMLVSSFPSYSWGGAMPLAGAPRDLYTQLLACSSSQSVVAIAYCLCAIFAVTSSLTLPI